MNTNGAVVHGVSKTKRFGYHNEEYKNLFTGHGTHRRCGGQIMKLAVGSCLGAYFECAKCGMWRNGRCWQ